MTRDNRRRRRSFARDDRGVSTTMGYVLTLAITASLISGLLIAGGSYIENQRDTVARDELQVIGDQLASGLSDADRLAATGGDDVRVELWLPKRVAGGTYSIELQNESGTNPVTATITGRSTKADVSVDVTVRTTLAVANTTVAGGPVVITARDVDGDSELELVVE